MQEVKMLKTEMGSECGKVTKEFLAGEVYKISDSLANSFIEAGMAITVSEQKVDEPQPGEADVGKKAKQHHSNKADAPKANKSQKESE